MKCLPVTVTERPKQSGGLSTPAADLKQARRRDREPRQRIALVPRRGGQPASPVSCAYGWPIHIFKQCVSEDFINAYTKAPAQRGEVPERISELLSDSRIVTCVRRLFAPTLLGGRQDTPNLAEETHEYGA